MKKNDTQNVKRIYITFRQMDGFELVLDAYSRYDHWFTRWLVMKKIRCCRKGRGTKEEEYRNLRSMYFFKKWPKIETAGDPGNVHWGNLGKSWIEKKTRISLSWITAILALLVCLMLLVQGKNLISYFKKASGAGVVCPAYMSKLEAHLDQRLPGKNQNKMTCYCK